MMKRIGFLGLMLAMAIGLFQPAVASAQDPYDYRGGYVHHDRDWRRDDRWRANEWREARERQEWRERQWREHERYERPYYSYGYRPPVVGFGLYGR